MKMRKIIICLIMYMLVFTTVAGAISSINLPMKSKDKGNASMSYSHTIIGEFFTMTTCEPCKYSHRALKALYYNGYHPFYFVTFVYDVNKKAKTRHDELGVSSSPTVVWDDGALMDQGSQENIEKDMAIYNNSIRWCGNRTVKDIDLNLDVDWLGATNPNPPHNSTGIPVEQNLSWQMTAMNINVTVDNNEATLYHGHLRVYVAECNSSYWYDTGGMKYAFTFLDWGFKGDINISGGGTWNNLSEWDGADHNNGYGEVYDEIYQDNCMVFASIFDKDNNDDADETAGFKAGNNNDPKTLDFYFGETYPPPQQLSNATVKTYNPFGSGNMSFNTTYYWKIDVWDNQGNPTYGNIWNFTTRDNSPPTVPATPNPWNDSFNQAINTTLSWSSNDPELDPITYDVYIGIDPLIMQIVQHNQTNTTYKPLKNFNFETKYYWQIKAWDIYEYNSTSPIWNFKTQANAPPYPAKDPIPGDGSSDAPEDVNLSWNGTDPNPGDILKYDVYFDDANPPKQVAWNLTGSTWNPPYNLTQYKTYYWRVVSWDSGGLSTVGPLWTFSPGENFPPSDPKIDGLKELKTGVDYQFTFVSIDQQDIKYYIKWGDGNEYKTGFYPSDEVITLNHTWTKPGTYVIQAQAEDIYGKKSNWSKYPVKVPKSKVLTNSLFLQFSEQFRDILPILRQLLIILS
jgi:hypothetical protein